jgi:rubrerythrin
MSKMVKPSHEEEEYFAKVEMEKRQNLAEKVKEDMANEDLEKLKALHYHHCAKCGFEMHSVVFKGVTIEKCPHCGGIFLDAEELEQLAGKEGGFISAVLSIFKT